MSACKDCGQEMTGSTCTACGYSAKRKYSHDDGFDHSKSCSYTYRGEKCLRLGTMSQGTKGEGPWMCREHFFGRKAATGPAKPDWRDADMAAHLAKHPELFRAKGEARSAYLTRIKAEFKAAAGKVGALPYDKQAAREAIDERLAIQGE